MPRAKCEPVFVPPCSSVPSVVEAFLSTARLNANMFHRLRSVARDCLALRSISAPLPTNLALTMSNFRSHQQIRKQRQPNQRQRIRTPRKMCLTNPLQEQSVHNRAHKTNRNRRTRSTLRKQSTRHHPTPHNQPKLHQPHHSQPQRRRKQQRQILSPPFSQLRKAAIHPRPHRISPKTKENLPSRPLHCPRQRHILQQISSNRRMPTHGLIRLAQN